ncbi:uncharacterized protein TRAVEDRAFT_75616 [Trametes versicolor FP-101664 SS1]|uniref:Thioesterase domain-containing protein n=1 Tax=Trametes versicolor (strain FP-101664) TaxID=717944 RepID=R7S7E1_TRAVS|nr:uncharacterized protein TRAVEDRAFT_75616 [Trametes versicolor FP-101664 SS1]EIW51891.1 hypothetical protein TRAVEDRAFT_75616 [Trametes versicolor FP-101664 SS1]
MNSDRDQSAIHFEGNLSPEQRSAILVFADRILRGRGRFAKSTGSRLEVTEVSLYEREEDKKTQMRMVFEVDVNEDMLNSGDTAYSRVRTVVLRPRTHRSCSFITLYALGIATDRKMRLVSQALTTVFHAPAKTGAKLRIVNTTVAFGARTVTARTEIWDATNRRLVASGVNSQMQPSVAKL